MARIRSVKPEFWTDEDLAEVPRDARLLYIGLWNLADEHGRLRGDPRYVKGQLFPYDDDLSAVAVDELLKELEGIGKVIRYRAGSGRYLFLPNLGKHQRLESEKVPSRLPPPSAEESARAAATLSDLSESRADKSARGADRSTPGARTEQSEPGIVTKRIGDKENLLISDDVDDPVPASMQARPDQGKHPAQVRADKSAPRADLSSLSYVAGSMEHVSPPSRKARKRETDDPAFDRFWALYPRKEGKKDATRAWPTAVKTASNPELIIAAAERYRDWRHGQDPRFTKTPAAWLNGERWLDQPPPAHAAAGAGREPPAAPRRIPRDEQCADHRGYPRNGCGMCKANRANQPTPETP